jgi:hypothetical protein
VLYPTLANRSISYVPFGVAALGVALYTLFGVRGRSDGAAVEAAGTSRRNGRR